MNYLDSFNNLLSLIGVCVQTGEFAAKYMSSFRLVLTQYLIGEGRQEDTKPEQVKALLEAIGSTAAADIQHLVDQAFPGGKRKLEPAQREELIGLLTRLTQNARFLTTQGSPRESYVRSERLLEQLLEGLDVKMHRGQVVGTGWTLERFLGMGSFGEVWLGKKPGVPQQHAFKFFTQDRGRELVLEEQSALYAIAQKVQGHPGVIQFLDFVLDPPSGEYPYLMLEYASLGSLEDWILGNPTTRTRIDVHQILLQIVSALASAHQHHIAHGDLKPANVLLAGKPGSAQAKIVDFGLSRTALHDTHTSSTSSHHGPRLGGGTWMYLPPEAQLLHVKRKPRQDDVFAFGVLWYQLIVGALVRPPYDFAENLRLKGADSHTIFVISRCLADPKRRFEDALQLQDHMRDIVPKDWTPPEGLLDVQDLFREYLSTHAV